MFAIRLKKHSARVQEAMHERKAGTSFPAAHVRMSVAFQHLSYWAPNGFRLLHNVTGYINPGEMVAIMGPSGSGKTTCLDVLAGRRRTGTQSGRVLINGNDRAERAASHAFNQNCGYMLQLAETFAVELTVRENLAYAAELRLPSSLSFEEKMQRVDELIVELKMVPIMDVKVGSATGGGISGGQKRKLMLATEMLALPAVLFLDEPTSGLDSTSALEVMGSLRNYCSSGRSVAVTIHQPRSEIFAAFDKLLLLYRGQVAFFGPPLGAATFLEETSYLISDATERGVADPNTNPADVVLDILNHEAALSRRNSTAGGEHNALKRRPGSVALVLDRLKQSSLAKSITSAAEATVKVTGTSKSATSKSVRFESSVVGKVRKRATRIATSIVTFRRTSSPTNRQQEAIVLASNIGEFAAAIYHVSGIASRISHAIDECVETAKGLPVVQADERRRRERYGGCGSALVGWWTQLWALESRMLLKTSPLVYLAAHVQFLILGGLFASLFHLPEEVYIVTGTLVNMASFPSALIMCPSISDFYASLTKCFEYEVAAGVVTPLQFMLQHIVHFEIWMCTGLLPFLVITYFSVFENPVSTDDLLYTIAFRIADCQVFLALFLAICAAFYLLGSRDSQMSLVVAATLHALFALFSGFFISLEDTPSYWKWANLISPRYYSVSSTFRINLQGYSTKECTFDASSTSAATELSQCVAAASGDAVLRRLSYKELNVETHMLVLFCMWLGLTLLGTTLLIYEHSTFTFSTCLLGKSKPPLSAQEADQRDSTERARLFGFDKPEGASRDKSHHFVKSFIKTALESQGAVASIHLFNVADEWSARGFLQDVRPMQQGAQLSRDSIVRERQATLNVQLKQRRESLRSPSVTTIAATDIQLKHTSVRFSTNPLAPDSVPPPPSPLLPPIAASPGSSRGGSNIVVSPAAIEVSEVSKEEEEYAVEELSSKSSAWLSEFSETSERSANGWVTIRQMGAE